MGLLLLLLSVSRCHSDGIVFVEVSLVVSIVVSCLIDQLFHVSLGILGLTQLFNQLFVLLSEHILEIRGQVKLDNS